MMRISFFVAIALLLQSPLLAEAEELFQKDRLYVDAGFGIGSTQTATATQAITNASYTLALIDTFQTDPLRRVLALNYYITTANSQAKASNPRDGRLFVEYAATSWLTWGAGVSYFSTTVSGGSLNRLDRLGYSAYIFILASGNNSLGAILYTLPDPIKVSATIPETQFAFHIPAGFADPYVRLSGGAGSGVSKGEMAYGSRFAISERAYAYGEMFYAVYNLSADNGFTAPTVINRGIRLGVGYAFDPPDKMKKK